MMMRIDPQKVIAKFRERMAYDFSSTQCNMPPDLSHEIYQWGRDNITDDLICPSEQRQPVDDIHVTLKYGIHSTDFTTIRDLLQSIGPIDVELGPITKFDSNPDYDVVKIDVESADLRRLNRLIGDSVEVTDTYPVYQPHITIAYVNKGACDDLIGREDFAKRKVKLDGVTFSGKDNRKTLMPLMPLRVR
jgi:2'-5' RNA ligase